MARFEWTYAHPSSTFADTLLVDGRRAAGEVARYTSVEPKGPVTRGRPMVIGEPFYAGFVRGERVPGEFSTLAAAHRAVEAAIDQADVEPPQTEGPRAGVSGS